MVMSPIPRVRGWMRRGGAAGAAGAAGVVARRAAARLLDSQGLDRLTVYHLRERAAIRSVTAWSGFAIGFLSRLPFFYNRQYCVIYPNLSIYHAILGALQQITTRFSGVYSAQIDNDLSGGGLRSCRRRRPLLLSPPLTVQTLKGH